MQSVALPLTPELVVSTYPGVGVVGVGQAFEAGLARRASKTVLKSSCKGVHGGNDSLVLVVTSVIKNDWPLTPQGSSNYVKWSLKS